MRLQELMEKKNEPGTYAGYKYDKDGVALLSKYAKDNELPNPLDPDKTHTTLLYSRKPCPDYKPLGKLDPPIKCKIKEMEVWPTQSKKNALVVTLDAPDMCKRHKTLMDEHEATYDFDEYKPHITLSYDIGDLDVDKLPQIRDTVEEIDAVEEYHEELQDEWNNQ